MGWEMCDCYFGETDELASGRHYLSEEYIERASET